MLKYFKEQIGFSLAFHKCWKKRRETAAYFALGGARHLEQNSLDTRCISMVMEEDCIPPPTRKSLVYNKLQYDFLLV